LGTAAEMRVKLRSWAASNAEYADLLPFLSPEQELPEPKQVASKEGWVYLLQSSAHYKIGRSDQLEKRVKQITIALPEATVMVHAIRTDDPVGIEGYWHGRFADRRANGEWFKLSKADILAFKKRKFM
ncbi:MAG: GIY-YIG nuclease family protein, partial [Bosea sp. (in: a-proteobacteria)]